MGSVVCCLEREGEPGEVVSKDQHRDHLRLLIEHYRSLNASIINVEKFHGCCCVYWDKWSLDALGFKLQTASTAFDGFPSMLS